MFVWLGKGEGGVYQRGKVGFVMIACVGGSCRLGGRLRWMVMVDRGQRPGGVLLVRGWAWMWSWASGEG